jgi:hypothetical protein
MSNIYLDAPDVVENTKEYKFKITAIGDKVIFNDIDEIDNYTVSVISSTKSITSYDGKKAFMYKRTYVLKPQNDFVLPSFEILIDDISYNTAPKNIKVTLPHKTTSDKFALSISSDKYKVYVGEQINYSVVFKYKDDIKISDLEFISAEFNNFWSKTLDNNTKIYKKDGYNYQELYFLLFAQKSGSLEIKPSKINLTLAGKYDENAIFSTADEQIEIFSNTLKFEAKALPSDISLIGKFNISTKIDKTAISKGEALNYQVTIEGIGNIDDVSDIKLDIPNTTIYANKAKKDFYLKKGLYSGVYTKSFSILAQDDFVIPSIKFRYFDSQNKISKEINTKSYHIALEDSGLKKDVPKRMKPEEHNSSKTISHKKQISSLKTKLKLLNNNQKLLYFSMGFVVAILLIIIIKILKENSKKKVKPNISLEKNIKQSQTYHELLSLILPYININSEIDYQIYRLEQLCYSSDEKSNVSINEIKKDIISLTKTIKQNDKGNEDEKDPFYTNDNI